LRAAQRVMADAAQRAGVTIDLRIVPSLPNIWADDRRVRQILLNLLSNAVKFTLPGGRIALEAWRAANGALVVTVRDTGIGMKAEDIAVAMAPFGQIDSGFGRRYEGTGLGLPLSKALTELHGGTFKLESEPGVGTTVILQFPPSRIREA
jgi:signal transduction histidine kinase